MIWVAAVIGILLVVQLAKLLLGKIRVGNLTKKAVLISGCDSGFGHLFALRCASLGIPTFAGCFTQSGAKELEAKAKNCIGPLWTVALDVTSEESIQKAVAVVKTELEQRGIDLWAIVNNSGIQQDGPDDWMTIKEYQKVADVNMFGMIRMCHAFKPLIKRSKGRIVNVTSMAARIARDGSGPYTTSKYGAEGYSDVLRREMAPFDVKVIIISPGSFDTPLTDPSIWESFVKGTWPKLSPEVQAEYQDYYKEQMEKFQSDVKSKEVRSTKLDEVVNAYLHAVTSVWPRYRYYAGIDAVLFYRPLSFMPEWLQDWILVTYEKYYG